MQNSPRATAILPVPELYHSCYIYHPRGALLPYWLCYRNTALLIPSVTKLQVHAK